MANAETSKRQNAQIKTAGGWETLLYVTLPQREEDRAAAGDALAALPDAARRLTGVALVLPHCTTAVDHPELPRQFCDAALGCGLGVTVGRRLWPAWDEQDPADASSASYYVWVLSELYGYAAGLAPGCRTMLDCEPYGTSVLKALIKRPEGLDPLGAAGVREAIKEAVARVPAADFVYPAASSNRNHFCWTLRELGDTWLQHETYTQMGPTAHSINPPVATRYQPGASGTLHSWGTWLTADDVLLAQAPGGRPLSAAGWAGLDWDNIAPPNPDCRVRWLYANRADLRDVLVALGKLETTEKPQ